MISAPPVEHNSGVLLPLVENNKVSHDCTIKQAVSCSLLHQKRQNLLTKLWFFGETVGSPDFPMLQAFIFFDEA